MRHRVLIVSASMGAGHDRAARELARRLSEQGHAVAVEDFLLAPPRPVGWILRRSYEIQLKYMAWSYELMYRVWFLVPLMVAPLARLASFLSRRGIGRWVERFAPDVVVSTYPLASQALASMRRKGLLDAPVATFLTDFGVHPLWVSPHVDLHLAVHPLAAEEAARRDGTPVSAPGPLVGPRFATLAGDRRTVARAAARGGLGLAPGDRAVLIVAGSWGVGVVGRTFRAVAESGRFVPIAVCGRDVRLQRRLARWVRRHGAAGRVIGWTDDMPSLMAAADVLVENAGGLTAMEAFASGLPVITYRPIPGHGRQNAACMAEAGVSRWARSRHELYDALDLLAVPGPARAAQVAAGLGMMTGDAAMETEELARSAAGVPAQVAPPVRSMRPRVAAMSRTAARVAALAAAITFLGIASNEGVSIATASGLGVVHARSAAPDTVFLAVRLDAADLADPAVSALVEQLRATAIVDAATAEAEPAAIRDLADHGVDVENGGAGGHIAAAWRRGDADIVRARHAVETVSGEPVALFVPSRHVDAIDLAWSRRAHTRIVVANSVVEPDRAAPTSLRAHRIYVVDGRRAATTEVVAELEATRDRLGALGLHSEPFTALG